MSKNNKRKKPTNQDFVNVINNLIEDINRLGDVINRQQGEINALANTMDLYIDYKQDNPGFGKHIDVKLEEMKQQEDDELQATGQSNTVANQTNSEN